MRHLLPHALFAALMLTLLAACGGNSGDGPAPVSRVTKIIGSSGGTIVSSDGGATLTIPPGALAGDTTISIEPVGDETMAIVAAIPHTGYALGPDGLSFAKPAQLTVRYAPADLPVGASEADLLLIKLRDDGQLQLARQLRVDAGAKAVGGEITGFSVYVIQLCASPAISCEPLLGTQQPLDLRVEAATTSSVTLSAVSAAGAGGDLPLIGYVLERAPATIADPVNPSVLREPVESDYVTSAHAYLRQVDPMTRRFRLTDPGLASGKDFRYRVSAVYYSPRYGAHYRVFPPSESIVGFTLPGRAAVVPAVPAHFVAAPDYDFDAAGGLRTASIRGDGPRVHLNWSAVADTEYYRIERRDAAGAFVEIAKVYGGAQYIDKAYDARSAPRFIYRLSAVNSAGASAGVLASATIMPGPGVEFFCFDDDSNGACDSFYTLPSFTVRQGQSLTIRHHIKPPTYAIGVPAPYFACEIALALFQASNGISQDAATAFSANPVVTSANPTAADYALEMHLSVAGDASLGTHYLTLYATGCLGPAVAKRAIAVEVLPSELLTAAFTTSPANAVAGQPVTFDASASTDDQPIDRYDWDFQDNGTVDANGVTVQFTYAAAGSYTARLTVVDRAGHVAQATRTVVVAPAGSIVNFFEGAFADADWTTSVYQNGNGGTLSAAQQTSGGNPGAYRVVTLVVNPGPPGGRSNIFSFHWHTPSRYDPAANGAIASIDYSEDALGPGVAAAMVVRQGGNVFFASPTYQVTTGTGWTTMAKQGLTAADFVMLAPDLTQSALHPDFSASGTPLEFGFMRALTSGIGCCGAGGPQGVDNWTATLHR